MTDNAVKPQFQTAETKRRSTGLSSAEVEERVARGETNAFKARVGRSYWDIFRDNVLNLFNIVLFSLLVVVLLFRDYATVIFAGTSVFTNTLLGMIQEMQAKRKLDQLSDLSADAVRVYRDGKVVRIPPFEIVKDDVLLVEPGDRIVVDGIILESDSLEIDESQLTGESDAVLKQVDDEAFSGSFVVAGTGTMVATRVGRESNINQLSTVAKIYKNVQTPTQQKIVAFVRLSVILMVITGPMIFLAGFINDLPPLEVFRNGVVFVTSLVPQGLVLTAILSLTLGAIAISRHETLVQRVNAVESMANVTMLCFDKTGTLTENKLKVHRVEPLNGGDLEQINRQLALYTDNLAHMNHTAEAIAAYNKQASNGAVPAMEKLREIPFTSARKWGAVVLEGETLVLGAPERVLNGDADDSAITERIEKLSAEGYRVLLLAISNDRPADNQLPDEREPLALIIISDTVRADIEDTLNAFGEQGVGLKVISGDNADTVQAIATQAGITTDHIYTGDELAGMADSDLETAALRGDVFARIEPETKRRLIAALKEQGHYVAMVGDGVNDVMALKEAHLAIVMNDGAQISKDIADIVLLNNAMSTLPRALREGTAITQVIFGTSKLFLVKNFYSLLFFMFVGFMSMPFPINPIQVSWVTFGTVNIVATLIAFQVLKPQHMANFRRDVLEYVITGGLVGAAGMALIYAVTYLHSDMDYLVARSAITVFLALFGAMVIWHTHGVDPLKPQTISKRPFVFSMGVILSVVTIAVPYLLPLLPEPMPSIGATFELVPLLPVYWVLLLAVFGIEVIAMSLMMRTRALIRDFWLLASD